MALIGLFMMNLIALLTLSLVLPKVVAIPLVPDPVVKLDYGIFQGAYSSDYNISYWMKIPFAAPPTGDNRFKAPQPPMKLTKGIYNSSQSFDFCPQRTVNGTEDCLYLGLYGRPWRYTSQPLRPVVMVFFGGAFIEGGGSFSLPPSGYPLLNVSARNDFVFVYPNYRVNAFGFLPGREVKESPTADLNAGLLDQQAALQWVNKYISKFGGDPNNVTIQGQSAGGGSVVAQVIANGGKTRPRLFSKALASSPFWPKTYKYDAPEAQAIYDTLVNMTNCSGPNSLQCLKAVDVQTIREASLAISNSHTYNTTSYTWAPVIDGLFLQAPLTEAIRKADVNIDYGFGMYNEFEGENFIPPGLSSANDTGSPPFNSTVTSFDNWLRGFLPKFSERAIASVEKLYPANGTAEILGTYEGSYLRAQLIYRDVVLACPALWMAEAAHVKGYVGEYAIPPAQHASDTEWWNQVNKIQTSSPLIYDGFTGSLASFFQTGDPNAHKLTNSSVLGVPEIWSTQEFAVLPDGFANIPIAETRSRCRFWQNLGTAIPI